MLDWNFTRTDHSDARKIAERFVRHLRLPPESLGEVEMDILAAHSTCPLDLERLYAANDLDFLHDVTGIREHLDRDTGELRGCFLPRHARRK